MSAVPKTQAQNATKLAEVEAAVKKAKKHEDLIPRFLHVFTLEGLKEDLLQCKAKPGLTPVITFLGDDLER